MMSIIEVECAVCGKKFFRNLGDLNRSERMGRKLFCSLRCSASESNLARRRKEIVKTCPQCGKQFMSDTGKKSATFCSRSCASKGSMSDARREAQRKGGLMAVGNLISPAQVLRRREAWKYDLLKNRLEKDVRDFVFEFEIGGFVFDLALLDQRILVEFDGEYHRGTLQRETDQKKDAVARDHGYMLVRRQVVRSTVIDPVTIEGL